MPMLPAAAYARGAAPILPAAACCRPAAPQAPQLPSAPGPRAPEPDERKQARRGRATARALGRDYALVPLTELGLLGRGAYGTVRTAHPLAGGPPVAVKCISKDGARAREVAVREARILKALDHDSVCRLLDVCEDESTMYLVMEHIDGCELFDEIGGDGLCDEHAVQEVMRQVLRALEHCHARGVVHRDIKPENIMLEGPRLPGARPVVKLIDFGLAAKGRARGRPAEPLPGTGPYLAPEARAGCTPEPSSDLWSAGVVLHALLTGLLLPPEVSAGRERLDLGLRALAGVSSGARDLLASLLQVDPRMRPTAAEAADHPWLLAAADPGGEDAHDDRRPTRSKSLARRESCDSSASTSYCPSPRRAREARADSCGRDSCSGCSDVSPRRASCPATAAARPPRGLWAGSPSRGRKRIEAAAAARHGGGRPPLRAMLPAGGADCDGVAVGDPRSAADRA